MKKFLGKLIAFFLLVVISWLVLYSISRKVNKLQYEKEYAETQTLILGDSHTKYLNEIIIPNTQNLSYEGETYKESYHKLKYLNSISDIKRLILAFSYHNFTNLAEQKILYEYHSVNRIATVANLRELYLTTQSKTDFLSVATRLHISPYILDFIGFDSANGGESLIDRQIHYREIAKMKKKARKKVNCKVFKEKRIKRHFRYQDVTDMSSVSSEEYLKKIVDFCQEHGIELNLINMPLHACYRNDIPPFYKKNLNRIIREYESHDLVTYLDYTKVYDSEPSMFRDIDHCTEYASSLITQKLYPH